MSVVFTNVPLGETTEVCLELLYYKAARVHNLEKGQLRKRLNFAVKENHFLFNGKLFDQVDGVAMSHLEQLAIKNFTGNLPLMYKRYVDDIFVIFNCSDDMENYFKWLNKQLVNLKFSRET